jgi:hypothetical protein
MIHTNIHTNSKLTKVVIVIARALLLEFTHGFVALGSSSYLHTKKFNLMVPY